MAILELIQKVNNRLEDIRSRLHLYDHSRWDAPIQLFNKREDFLEANDYYKKVKERLVKYYYRTFETLLPKEIETSDIPTLFTQNKAV